MSLKQCHPSLWKNCDPTEISPGAKMIGGGCSGAPYHLGLGKLCKGQKSGSIGFYIFLRFILFYNPLKI